MNQFAIEEIARIIAERGTPDDRPAPEMRGYNWFDANVDALAPITLDQSPKARALRKVKRIAAKYPWGGEVIRRAMDASGCWDENDLPADAVAVLLAEMQRQDDRAMAACDDEDPPPAR